MGVQKCVEKLPFEGARGMNLPAFEVLLDRWSGVLSLGLGVSGVGIWVWGMGFIGSGVWGSGAIKILGGPRRPQNHPNSPSS